jgi:hypothetical protein
MIRTMNLQTRREILTNIRFQYQEAGWLDKGKILDGFVAASGYDRKYAIKLLNSIGNIKKQPQTRQSRVKYDAQVKQALVTIWYAANQICSKRLVPFIPELVCAMERHGHLHLPTDVREKLLGVSRSTVDRILSSEKERAGKSISTTKPGNLFKHQIQVRTFADWDDVIPGFLEADLVAHCGGNTNGAFLNTLTLTDITTGWTECMPLLRKSAGDVIIGLKIAQELLPFPLLGIDTDNGSEFINHDLMEFCEDNKITFTRSRAYRKNDQAHVEEKNGSIVRRIVGYDRFEGRAAWEALSELYSVLRLYVNFFQPSLKLLSKTRCGGRVTKKYDTAKTPHQRAITMENIDPRIKDALNEQYEHLDPVGLLKKLETLQKNLFNYAWSKNTIFETPEPLVSLNNLKELPDLNSLNDIRESKSQGLSSEKAKLHHYRYTKKGDKNKGPRDWRTRKDPFERVWDEIKLKLELNPEQTAKALLKGLIIKYPADFKPGQIRTLQRRVSDWRGSQLDHEARLREMMQTNEARVL